MHPLGWIYHWLLQITQALFAQTQALPWILLSWGDNIPNLGKLNLFHDGCHYHLTLPLPSKTCLVPRIPVALGAPTCQSWSSVLLKGNSLQNCYLPYTAQTGKFQCLLGSGCGHWRNNKGVQCWALIVGTDRIQPQNSRLSWSFHSQHQSDQVHLLSRSKGFGTPYLLKVLSNNLIVISQS